MGPPARRAAWKGRRCARIARRTTLSSTALDPPMCTVHAFALAGLAALAHRPHPDRPGPDRRRVAAAGPAGSGRRDRCRCRLRVAVVEAARWHAARRGRSVRLGDGGGRAVRRRPALDRRERLREGAGRLLPPRSCERDRHERLLLPARPRRRDVRVLRVDLGRHELQRADPLERGVRLDRGVPEVEDRGPERQRDQLPALRRGHAPLRRARLERGPAAPARLWARQRRRQRRDRRSRRAPRRDRERHQRVGVVASRRRSEPDHGLRCPGRWVRRIVPLLAGLARPALRPAARDLRGVVLGRQRLRLRDRRRALRDRPRAHRRRRQPARRDDAARHRHGRRHPRHRRAPHQLIQRRGSHGAVPVRTTRRPRADGRLGR